MCGSMIEVGQPRFIFRGELFCAYDGGTFDEMPDRRKQDLKQEMERLIQLAEAKSEKELIDEVYYQFNLDLCTRCRKKVYAYLENS